MSDYVLSLADIDVLLLHTKSLVDKLDSRLAVVAGAVSSLSSQGALTGRAATSAKAYFAEVYPLIRCQLSMLSHSLLTDFARYTDAFYSAPLSERKNAKLYNNAFSALIPMLDGYAGSADDINWHIGRAQSYAAKAQVNVAMPNAEVLASNARLNKAILNAEKVTLDRNEDAYRLRFSPSGETASFCSAVALTMNRYLASEPASYTPGECMARTLDSGVFDQMRALEQHINSEASFVNRVCDDAKKREIQRYDEEEDSWINGVWGKQGLSVLTAATETASFVFGVVADVCSGGFVKETKDFFTKGKTPSFVKDCLDLASTYWEAAMLLQGKNVDTSKDFQGHMDELFQRESRIESMRDSGNVLVEAASYPLEQISDIGKDAKRSSFAIGVASSALEGEWDKVLLKSDKYLLRALGDYGLDGQLPTRQILAEYGIPDELADVIVDYGTSTIFDAVDETVDPEGIDAFTWGLFFNTAKFNTDIWLVADNAAMDVAESQIQRIETRKKILEHEQEFNANRVDVESVFSDTMGRLEAYAAASSTSKVGK